MSYNAKCSFPTDQPPHDDGEYAVKFEDGTTGMAEWENGMWKSDATILRYSGLSMSLPLARQEELVSRILGGIALPSGSALRRDAQAAALDLARHFAAKAARSDVESDTAHECRRNTIGFYTVARVLGVTFDRLKGSRTPDRYEATNTDRALFEARIAEFPDVRASVEWKAEREPVDGELTEWALGALEKRKAKAARFAAKKKIKKAAQAASQPAS